MESKQTTTWYLARWGQITEVEVIKKLPKSLVIKQRRFKALGNDAFIEKTVRNTSYEKYFETKAEARDFIIKELQNDVANAAKDLTDAQLNLAKFLNSGE